MLRVNNIEVKYGGVILTLRGVSLEGGEGSIRVLVGSNGAGKTTLLKAISGLLKTELGDVTEGSIEFYGQRIDNRDPEEIVRIGITQVLQGRMVFEHLTTGENLLVGAHLRRERTEVKKDLDLIYSYFPILKSLRHRMSGYLSGGEQQMLVIGRALMARPKLMLLDEPSLGLAPIIVQHILNILKRINAEEGTSIFMVEQNIRAALTIAEYGYVMENGRIVLEGPTARLRDNKDMKEFYLGISAAGGKKGYRAIKSSRGRKRWL